MVSTWDSSVDDFKAFRKELGWNRHVAQRMTSNYAFTPLLPMWMMFLWLKATVNINGQPDLDRPAELEGKAHDAHYQEVSEKIKSHNANENRQDALLVVNL